MANHRYIAFWPQDWMNDPGLRRCSPPARALWIDLICMAHNGEPYGHVTIDGVPATVEEISSVSRIPPAKVRCLIDELSKKRVCSIAESGAIFSRRMVRDREKSEKNQHNGSLGGNPSLKPSNKPPVKPPDNGGVKANIKSNQYKSNQYKSSAREGAAQEAGKENFGFKGERVDRSHDHDQPSSDNPRFAQVVAFTTKALTTKLPYGTVRTKNEQIDAATPPRKVKPAYLTPEQLAMARRKAQ